VRTWASRLTAFAVSGFFAGVAGSLYAFLVQTAALDDFRPERSIFVFGVAVIGGLGSVMGAVAGAVYVLGVDYFLPSWASFLATAVGIIIFLLAFPGGLGELLLRIRDRYLARVAARRQIVVPSLVADVAQRAAPTPPAAILSETRAP
ncbi:MAG: ABC transporter permease subunit, partial [Anaerolineales bacterium]